MPITYSRQTRREFWEAVRSGLLPQPAAVAVGVAPNTGQNWFRQAGGVITNGQCQVGDRFLSLAEREEIAVGLAAKDSLRAIAARLGRSPSTVSREVARNSNSRGVYRAWRAEEQTAIRARRPKTTKLAANPVLASLVQQLLGEYWSPEQISLRLRDEFGDDKAMRVSHETIYQSLYVQGRGELRRELAACLRTGRALRQPQRHATERRAGSRTWSTSANAPPRPATGPCPDTGKAT